MPYQCGDFIPGKGNGLPAAPEVHSRIVEIGKSGGLVAAEESLDGIEHATAETVEAFPSHHLIHHGLELGGQFALEETGDSFDDGFGGFFTEAEFFLEEFDKFVHGGDGVSEFKEHAPRRLRRAPVARIPHSRRGK